MGDTRYGEIENPWRVAFKDDPLFQKSLKVEGNKCEKYGKSIKNIVLILQDLLKDTSLEFSHICFPSSISSIWKTVHYIYQNQYNPTEFSLYKSFGKGSNLEKAQASGYGELMERIQLGYMFSKNMFKPTLRPKSIKKISSCHQKKNEEFAEILSDINPYLPKKWEHKKVYVPYINLKDKSYTPIESRFLIDTTGAAAGNTYSEAFVQGICELFERFCAGYVLLNKIKCPTISKSYLSKKNQKIIDELEEKNIKIIIKDLSLGAKRLPVIATIFLYPCEDNNLPNLELKVASAPSLNNSFERTITEILQKEMNHKFRLLMTMKTLNSAEKLYNSFPHLRKYLPFRNFVLNRFSHRSIYIEEDLKFLLEDNKNYSPISYYDKDSTKEMNKLIEIIKLNCWNIYYKFYNWLKFPTIKLFSPNLNFGYRSFTEYKTNAIRLIKIKLIHKNFKLDEEEIKLFSNSEFLVHCWMNGNLASFLNIELKSLENISPWKILGLISYYNENKELAIKFLKINEGMILQDIELFKNKDSILNYLQRTIPNCSKACWLCYHKNECKTFSLMNLENRILAKNPKSFEKRRYLGNELKYFA
jgi:YcaO-like protein with predicted kinase domain